MDYVRELKAKLFDIESGKLIAVLHENTVKHFGIGPLERVEIECRESGRRVVTVVDTTTTMVKEDEIGLFEDVARQLAPGEKTVCGRAPLKVRAVPRPNSVQLIKKKMDGYKLSTSEIREIVNDLGSNRLSEIEATAFVSAVYINGFDLDEIAAMTQALVDTGQQLKLARGPVLDKHSIGGVNGRATMVLVPIVMAAGYRIPKTSARSITSAAGTADAMEVLTNVSLSIADIQSITESVGGVVAWGGAVDLAPADDKIIKIEHPLSLDPEGQVIASVLAKKVSVGAEYLVIDIPIGPDVKVKSRERGEEMAKKFVEVGKRMGIKVQAVLTDGAEPSGPAFGPALEAKAVLEILEGRTYDNLARKSCELAGVLLEMIGHSKPGKGYAEAKELLLSGKAWKKFEEMALAQGKGRAIVHSEDVPLGSLKEAVVAKEEGEINKINVKNLVRVARAAGAPANKGAGVLLLVKEGDRVRKGQPLYEIYCESQRRLELARVRAQQGRVFELEHAILERFG